MSLVWICVLLFTAEPGGSVTTLVLGPYMDPDACYGIVDQVKRQKLHHSNAEGFCLAQPAPQ
jgi:hypothetical protein